LDQKAGDFPLQFGDGDEGIMGELPWEPGEAVAGNLGSFFGERGDGTLGSELGDGHLGRGEVVAGGGGGKVTSGVGELEEWRRLVGGPSLVGSLRVSVLGRSPADADIPCPPSPVFPLDFPSCVALTFREGDAVAGGFGGPVRTSAEKEIPLPIFPTGV